MFNRRLFHYSTKPLKSIYSVPQANIVGDKPRGLWISCAGEDDWQSWCTTGGFRLYTLAVVTEVLLTSNNNILFLETFEDIITFTAEYRTNHHGTYYMNWEKVEEEYDGVIISPYQWGLRLNDQVRWYYTWDCACGCIWKKEAVTLA
jgi:hypothetical protein